VQSDDGNIQSCFKNAQLALNSVGSIRSGGLSSISIADLQLVWANPPVCRGLSLGSSLFVLVAEFDKQLGLAFPRARGLNTNQLQTASYKEERDFF